jgi:hypothetical protein
MNNDAINVMMGVCRFCGQALSVHAETQEEADARATLHCRCPGALQAKRVTEIIRDAKDKADDLLGEIGEADGFVPVTDDNVRALIDAAIERAAYGDLREAAFQITGHGAVKIKRTDKGGVKIERSRTLKRSEETV